MIHVIVFCDNEYDIKLALNPFFQEKQSILKSIYTLSEKKITSGVLKVEKINSSKQMADNLTKNLSISQHNFLLNEIGLINHFNKNWYSSLNVKFEKGVLNIVSIAKYCKLVISGMCKMFCVKIFGLI